MSLTPHNRFTSRTLRQGLLTAAIAVAATAAMAATRLIPHDTRLDDADAALEKANVLLLAVNCAATDKAAKECERAVAKAVDATADARQYVAEAATAQDAGGNEAR